MVALQQLGGRVQVPAAEAAAARSRVRRASSRLLPVAPAACALPVQLSLAGSVHGSSCSRRSRAARSRVTTQANATASEAPAAQGQAPPKAPVKKQSDVRSVQVADGVTSLRCVVAERLKLEIEYSLDRGSSDNSYVVKGDKATALIDVPDDAFAESFAAALRRPAGPDFQFIVLAHFSPRRAAALAAVIAARAPNAPPVEIWCSNPAAQTLQALLRPGPGGSEELQAAWKTAKGLRARLRTVRGGDVLPLGANHNLRFILTPTPRWPDGMCVYDSNCLLLFTSKLFSAHVGDLGSGHKVSPYDDGGWDAYRNDWRFFFDCMLAPVAKQVAQGLEKLDIEVVALPPNLGDSPFPLERLMNAMTKGVRKMMPMAGAAVAEPGKMAPPPPMPEGPLPVGAICPLHGPILRTSVSELMREYREWTELQITASKKASIAVIYASAYGNTAALAQAIARGATKAGVGVESMNCEFATAEEVADLVKRTNGFVLGSPTLGGHMPTPVKSALGAILREGGARTKPCGVFGSFGWSGEAVDELESRLKDGGFGFGFEAIRCKFKPTESTLQMCEESGTDLAKMVLKESRKKARESERMALSEDSRGTAQAVGRIIGSLCVMTAKKGDATSAMLASWVSQASFNPPALTVAVSKDRAIEGLVLPGSSFVLNVLGSGSEKAVFKALAKEFQPGEDRFGGLETQLSEKSGCAILPAVSTAFLECTVTDRMETGDHWVLLARVDDGTLLNDQTLTALHHRKSGTSY